MSSKFPMRRQSNYEESKTSSDYSRIRRRANQHKANIMENINRLSEVELERIDQLLKENSVDDNEVCQEDLDLEEQQYADMIL